MAVKKKNEEQTLVLVVFRKKILENETTGEALC